MQDAPHVCSKRQSFCKIFPPSQQDRGHTINPSVLYSILISFLHQCSPLIQPSSSSCINSIQAFLGLAQQKGLEKARDKNQLCSTFSGCIDPGWAPGAHQSCCIIALLSWKSPAGSLLQSGLPMGLHPPLDTHLLQPGILQGLLVDTCSTIDFHGLPLHSLLHRLQGNLSSGSWSISSSSFCILSIEGKQTAKLPLGSGRPGSCSQTQNCSQQDSQAGLHYGVGEGVPSSLLHVMTPQYSLCPL